MNSTITILTVVIILLCFFIFFMMFFGPWKKSPVPVPPTEPTVVQPVPPTYPTAPTHPRIQFPGWWRKRKTWKYPNWRWGKNRRFGAAPIGYGGVV